MAFPRANAFSYWIFLFSGIFLYTSLLIGQAPHAGWFAYPPYTEKMYSPALADIGPDLTHIASRQTIAGGMLVNDTANLEAWITHAQSLKPGTPMPDLPEFHGADLRALVAYLQTLK